MSCLRCEGFGRITRAALVVVNGIPMPFCIKCNEVQPNAEPCTCHICVGYVTDKDGDCLFNTCWVAKRDRIVRQASEASLTTLRDEPFVSFSVCGSLEPELCLFRFRLCCRCAGKRGRATAEGARRSHGTSAG